MKHLLVVSAWEKNKTRKGDQECVAGLQFNRVVRGGVNEKATSEQRPGGERGSLENIRGKSGAGRGPRGSTMLGTLDEQ